MISPLFLNKSIQLGKNLNINKFSGQTHLSSWANSQHVQLPKRTACIQPASSQSDSNTDNYLDVLFETAANSKFVSNQDGIVDQISAETGANFRFYRFRSNFAPTKTRPVTDQRVLIKGQIDQIKSALNLVLDSVASHSISDELTEEENQSLDQNDDTRSVRLVVYPELLRAMFVEEGKLFNYLRSEFGCQVLVLSRECPPNYPDVITISGAQQQVISAIGHMLQFFQDEQLYNSYIYNQEKQVMRCEFETASMPISLRKNYVQTKLSVTDLEAGVIIGKGGANIKRIVALSRVGIRVTNDEIEGTRRYVELSGELAYVQYALQLIGQLYDRKLTRQLQQRND